MEISEATTIDSSYVQLFVFLLNWMVIESCDYVQAKEYNDHGLHLYRFWWGTFTLSFHTHEG